MYDPNKRLRGESQDQYCHLCCLVDGCNVQLRDNEDCQDRIHNSSVPDGSLPMDENND
jgi:hypothetical protein